MTEGTQNFDPYIDWSKTTDEQAREMAKRMSKARMLANKLMFTPNAELLAQWMEAQQEMAACAEEIEEELWTTPAMVHIAGPVGDEEAADGSLCKIQRCSRCKSVLTFWRHGMYRSTYDGAEEVGEEDADFFPEGTALAKITRPFGMHIYSIDGRELEKHERECVAMPDIDTSEIEGFEDA